MEEKNVNSGGVEVAESLNERIGGVVTMWLSCHSVEEAVTALNVLCDFCGGDTHELLHDTASMFMQIGKEIEAE